MITQERLKELLDYHPDSRKFYWKVSKAKRTRIGDEAGYRTKKGYIHIGLDGKLFKAHRLAFLFMKGFIPEEVDHRNNIKSDNRWENLRESTHSQNQRNTVSQKNSTSGCKNVSFNKKEAKWKVTIQVNKKPIHLGYYKDFELAELIAIEARALYHGEFATL